MPPLTEGAYLDELTARARSVLGDHLIGAYAGGSWALGDYRPGRSDLDVAIVCAAPLGDEAIDALAARLRHESLPCPARGLELVAYTRATAGSGTAEPGFELNLNTGPRMPYRLERHSGTDESHWYAIDRAILAEHGVALTGSPAAEMFTSPPRTVLLDLLARSLRWHELSGAAATDDTLLNAARAIVYVRDGEWVSKPEAARRLLTDGDWQPLLSAASEGRTEALDPRAVRSFLHTAAEVVATGKRREA